MNKSFKSILEAPIALAVLAVIVFEEWIWKRTKLFMEQFAKLPVIKQMNLYLSTAHPFIAASAFLIPVICMFPAKIAGIWLFSHGHAIDGTVMFFGAKIIGAALAGRIYSITENTLRTIPWLSKSIDFVVNKKNQIKNWTKSTSIYRKIEEIKSQWKISEKSFFNKTWAKYHRVCRKIIKPL